MDRLNNPPGYCPGDWAVQAVILRTSAEYACKWLVSKEFLVGDIHFAEGTIDAWQTPVDCFCDFKLHRVTEGVAFLLGKVA